MTSILRTIRKERWLLLMALPGLLYFVIFQYMPMYGVLMAFQDYSVGKGVWGSDWIGFEHFVTFFTGYDAYRIIRNTLLLSLYTLILGFPVPILFALLLNELRLQRFKRITQTVSYLPHFISTVIVVGMVVNFLKPDSGIINVFLNRMFGMEPVMFLMEPQYFRSIYVSMDIWKSFGWGAIIYLAALTGTDPQLYEAAVMDGANRFKQVLHITIPSIMPVVVILLILKMGSIMNTSVEAIILLYNPLIYETADTIDTYVYRRGLVEANYSFGAAVGLFKSVIGLVLVFTVNAIARRAGTSLW